MAQVPSEYVDILNRIKSAPTFNSTIIAGGAVRDSHLGVPIKDIDIFCPSERNDQWLVNTSATPDMARQLFDVPARITRTGSINVDYDTEHHISAVWDVEFKTPMPMLKIQLIFVADDITPLQYVTDYFDVGICKCWHDGVRAHYTDAFHRDVQNKTLTFGGIMSGVTMDNCIRSHLVRLRKKFPQYQVAFDLRAIENYYKAEGLA